MKNHKERLEYSRMELNWRALARNKISCNQNFFQSGGNLHILFLIVHMQISKWEKNWNWIMYIDLQSFGSFTNFVCCFFDFQCHTKYIFMISLRMLKIKKIFLNEKKEHLLWGLENIDVKYSGQSIVTCADKTKLINYIPNFVLYDV